MSSYLSLNGKTIGDFRLNQDKTEYLNVYGGFTPSGSQQKRDAGNSNTILNTQVNTLSDFFNRNRAAGDVADGTLPESTQDNLGAYTLQSGDSLESIALQVYGDSSLWYLIADANGLSERKSVAGHTGSMQIGQRLNIPPASIGQHHTSKTHKVLNSTQMIGSTSATTPLPPVPPPVPKKNASSLFAKIVVAVVAVVAVMATAGAIGMMAGVAGSSLFTIGAAS